MTFLSKGKKPINKVNLWALIVLIGGNLLFFLTLWLVNKYDNIFLDQILFQLKSPSVGANKNILTSAYVQVGLFSVILTSIEVFLYFLLAGRMAEGITLNRRFFK